MKIVKCAVLTSFLLITATVMAQTSFRYQVNVRNTYPLTTSVVQLDPNVSPNVIPDVPSYYNPFPPNIITGPGQAQFVYCGGLCGSGQKVNLDDSSPYVIYTISAPDPANPRNMTNLLTCKFTYGFSNGSCQAAGTPLTMSNLPGLATPGCKGIATNVANGCNVEFKFYSPVGVSNERRGNEY